MITLDANKPHLVPYFHCVSPKKMMQGYNEFWSMI